MNDTADAQQQWILKTQARGMCTCDDEHMFNCPDTDYTNDYSDDKDELDQVTVTARSSTSKSLI